MARESKRKRDERRFGKAERLADLILGERGPNLGCSVFALSPHWRTAAPELLRVFREKLARCVIVDASNVADYYYSLERSQFDCTQDFPCCRPAFPMMFIEFRRPAIYRDEKGTQPFDPSFYGQWGWIVESLPAADLPRESGDATVDREIVPMLDLPGIHSIIRMSLASVQRGILIPNTITYFLPIDEAGTPLAANKYTVIFLPGDDTEKAAAIAANVGQLAHTAYLAMSFINCRNVAMTAVEPDAKTNRARLKGGLKPFARYYTLEIEGMKEVLRAEGGAETGGIVRALHLCRGHFATLTRNNKGEALERPTRYFRQAHVRGHAPGGIVAKDYRVNVPRAEAPPC